MDAFFFEEGFAEVGEGLVADLERDLGDIEAAFAEEVAGAVDAEAAEETADGEAGGFGEDATEVVLAATDGPGDGGEVEFFVEVLGEVGLGFFDAFFLEIFLPGAEELLVRGCFDAAEGEEFAEFAFEPEGLGGAVYGRVAEGGDEKFLVGGKPVRLELGSDCGGVGLVLCRAFGCGEEEIVEGCDEVIGVWGEGFGEVILSQGDAEELVFLFGGADGRESIGAIGVEEGEGIGLELSGGGALSEHGPSGEVEADVEGIRGLVEVEGPLDGMRGEGLVVGDIEAVFFDLAEDGCGFGAGLLRGGGGGDWALGFGEGGHGSRCCY